MGNPNSARFHQLADRNDARVILAAELSANGAEKQFVAYYDQLAKAGVVDVFVGDDDDEPVLIKLKTRGEKPVWKLVTKDGLRTIEPVPAQGLD